MLSVLDGGDTDGGGPDGCNEAKGELAGRGSGGGLVEGLQHGTEGSSGNDECEVVKEIFVDTVGGAGGEAEDGACAEERGEKGEEEVEAKFGGVSEDVVGEEGPPGPLGDDVKGDALKIPERAEGKARHDVPDALLAAVEGLAESVIGAHDS